MFILFDSNDAAGCENCENPKSVMHLSIPRSRRGINLCVACFRALTLVMVRASEKLRPASSPDRSEPSMVPA